MSNTPEDNNTTASNAETSNISVINTQDTATQTPATQLDASNTENSVIKTMRNELKTQKQKLKELESAGETNAILQTQIKALEEQISNLNNNLKAEKVATLSSDLNDDFKELLAKELLNSDNPEDLIKEWRETKPNYFAKRATVQVNTNISTIDPSKLSTFQKTILSHYK